MTAVDNETLAPTRRQHSIWSRMCAEFAGSLLICFSIYIMCSFGSAFYNVNLAYIALGTGVVYAAMTAIFAKVSGAQFNPAITVAAMLTSKTRVIDGVLYIIAQLLGAVAAGALFLFLLPSSESVPVSQWLSLVVNGYDEGSSLYATLTQMGLTYSVAMAIVIELIASIIVVAAAMQSMKRDGAPTRQHTLIMGLAYAAATAMAYPVTGATVNPLRPTGIAVFASNKSLTVNPLSQLWVFWVSSILAAALVALVMIVAQLLSNRSAGKDGSDDVAEAAMIEDQTANDTDIPSVEDEVATTALTGTQADADYSVIEQEDAQVERQ